MSKKTAADKKISRKEVRQLVYDKLAIALAEFKAGVKDKKYESNLQKASKLFADDIVKAANKDKTKAKKASKKITKKKIVQKVEAPENN